MTNINGAGHHNVEDILASIRTSIAGEGMISRPLNGEIHPPQQSPYLGGRQQTIADEAAEFELPAIFKPGHQQAQEKPKLLGRLSDALKTAGPVEAARLRTVVPFETPLPRMPEPRTQQSARSQAAPQSAYQSRPQPAPGQSAAQAPREAEVKRTMPTFFDTRINKLGELTRQAYQPRLEAPKPGVAPQQFAAPALPEAPPAYHPQQQRQQPMLPEGNLANQMDGVVEDAAAQLLRPMLRQWLTENMPKIVEKALRSEAGMDGDPAPRKPAG